MNLHAYELWRTIFQQLFKNFQFCEKFLVRHDMSRATKYAFNKKKILGLPSPLPLNAFQNAPREMAGEDLPVLHILKKH